MGVLLVAEQADTNWLLSSAAQSAAALVAIIGGFLVSRLVTLSSERAGLTRRLHEVEDELRRREEALVDFDERAAKRAAELAVWDSKDRLVTSSGQLDGETLLSHLDPDDYDVDREHLIARLDAAADAVQRAFGYLRRREDTQTWPENWAAAKRALRAELPDEDPDLLELVYKEAAARKASREEKKRRAEEARRAGGVKGGGALAALSSPWRQPFSFVAPPVQPLSPGAFRKPSREELQHARDEAEAELRLVQTALARVAIPPDLGIGFAVLAYFAAAGIAYPVVLMSLGQMTLGPWWRGSVVFAFLSGLVGLMAYLGWVVRRTTRRE